MRNALSCVLALCEDIDTPRSLTVHILVRSEAWGELARLTCEPHHYLDYEPDRFAYDNLITVILKKVPMPGFDAKREARTTFYTVERQLVPVTDRLDVLKLDVDERTNFSFEQPIVDVVLRMRRFVSRLLGSLPENLEGRFGPGSVYETRGRSPCVPDKMSTEPTITELARPFKDLPPDRFTANLRFDNVVRGNRFTSVPKTTLTDRGICVEPSLNIYYQLAVGAHLKSRILHATGIDLSGSIGEGQYRHHRLLRSSWTSLATIDLSNASDTVSTSLVELILPEDWFSLLDSLRCRVTLIDGRSHFNLKFSSMGNGFTFELETILFMAILYGIGLTPGVNSLVYGDDIILPKGSFHDACSALRFFGFTPNPRKSYCDSVFRESCGFDLFNGFPVRGFYLKELPHEPSHWIVFANGLNRFCQDRGFNHITDSPLKRTWFRILDAIPSHVRGCRGPSSLGDVVIHDTPSRWSSERRYGVLRVRGYAPVSFKIRFSDFSRDVQLLSALYGCWDSPRGEPQLAARGAVKGHRMRWFYPGL